MKTRNPTIFLALLLFSLGLMPVQSAHGQPLSVSTSLPVLAKWTSALGGDAVEVSSLIKGLENPHTYEPRVSDIRRVAKADLVITIGLGLEEWMEGLLADAGREGRKVLVASKGVYVLEDEEHEEEHDDHGDADDHDHADGNPHVWLDPANGAVMVANIAESLTSLLPDKADEIAGRRDEYLAALEKSAVELKALVADLEDNRFLSYHPAWPYFAKGFGFELAGVITEKPGQEPSAKALAGLIDRVRREKIRMLVTEPQLSSEFPNLLAEETDISIVELSPLVGTGGAATYLEMLDTNVRLLVNALESGGGN